MLEKPVQGINHEDLCFEDRAFSTYLSYEFKNTWNSGLFDPNRQYSS